MALGAWGPTSVLYADTAWITACHGSAQHQLITWKSGGIVGQSGGAVCGMPHCLWPVGSVMGLGATHVPSHVWMAGLHACHVLFSMEADREQ